MTTAVDTTVGARHDFDDMVLFFARTDVFADFFRVGKSMHLAEIERNASDSERGFANAFSATYVVEFEVARFFARELFCSISQDGFGDATGDAKDDAATGLESEWVVACDFSNVVECFDASFAYHGAEFDGGHAEVDVLDAVV